MKSRIDLPQLLVIIIMLFGIGGILLFQILKQQDLYFLNKFYLGLDYKDFYNASLLVREGENPYTIARYTTPPIPAMFNIPLTYISLPIAKIVMSFLSFLSVLLSLFLAHRIFNGPNRKIDGIFFLVSIIILFFSYPFHFLFDRGNIDGLVLLLISFGIYCLRKHNALAGFLFGLAISFKVYPVLIILPLLIWRRWKSLSFLILTMTLLFLLAPQLWIEFLQERILVRTSLFRIDENGSLANTFFYIGSLFNIGQVFKNISFYIYLSLLGLSLYLDFKKKHVINEKNFYASVMMYIPFMVAVPQLAYHYELICVLPMLPVVSWLWHRTIWPLEKIILTFITIGIALSQFQAVAAEKLIGAVYPHFIPGFGLFMVIIGVTIYKMLWIFTYSFQNDAISDGHSLGLHTSK